MWAITIMVYYVTWADSVPYVGWCSFMVTVDTRRWNFSTIQSPLYVRYGVYSVDFLHIQSFVSTKLPQRTPGDLVVLVPMTENVGRYNPQHYSSRPGVCWGMLADMKRYQSLKSPDRADCADSVRPRAFFGPTRPGPEKFLNQVGPEPNSRDFKQGTV